MRLALSKGLNSTAHRYKTLMPFVQKKSNTLLLGSLLLVPLILGAVLGSPAKTAYAVAFKTNKSTLKFNTRNFKAGTVFRGQKVLGDFQFINVGRNPVKILGIHNPCGCSLSQSAVSSSYSAGQRGNLRVSFDTRHFSGHFQKKILLSVVAEQKQILVPLLISATVKEDIAVNPPILAFTPKDVAKQTTQWVQVDFKKLKGRKISFDYDKRFFRITVPDGSASTSGNSVAKEGRFGVQVVARPQTGWRQKTILVNNSSPHLPQLPLMVVYQTEDGIKVRPEHIEFGPISYQKSRSADITLKGPSRKQLNRIEVHVAIDQKPEPDAGKWVKATRTDEGKITVTATNKLDRNGSLTGKVTLWADINPDLRYIIPIYGYFSR